MEEIKVSSCFILYTCNIAGVWACHRQHHILFPTGTIGPCVLACQASQFLVHASASQLLYSTSGVRQVIVLRPFELRN